MTLECCESMTTLIPVEIKFKNGSYVQELLDAILLSAALAIIKLLWHFKLDSRKLRVITLLRISQGMLPLKRAHSGQNSVVVHKGIILQIII